MSVVRIVGGDMKNTSKGKLELWAKGGDFEINAARHNQWIGEEGIGEKSYRPLDSRDSLQKSPKVLTISFFFDGTLNNKYNTEAREKNTDSYKEYSNKKDDSYTNDYSNVAKGFESAMEVKDESIKIYIEGIGTTNNSEDDALFGPAMGGLDTGIKGKVKKSFDLLNDKLEDIINKEYDDIHINVFGFSRGAAAARHFLSIANQKVECKNIDKEKYVYPPTKGHFSYQSNQLFITLDHGMLDYTLLRNQIKYKRIKFSFAGLYDTVSSFWFPHSDDANQLDLEAIRYADISIQIQSLDEYRYNFDITNIRSSGIRGLELFLPGVHSDIGGSYPATVEEKIVLHIGTKSSCNKFKEILIQEGWFRENQLKIRATEISEIKALLKILEKSKASGISNTLIKEVLEGINGLASNIYSLVGKRRVKNNYDKIPLIWMFEQSDAYLKYNDKKKEENKDFKDKFIEGVYHQLLGYLNGMSKYRNYYVKLYNATNNSTTKQDIEREYMNYKNIDIFKYEDKELYLNYKSHIDEESLKRLRNEYFHWSSRYEIAHIPRVLSAEQEENRKRKEHNG